MGSAGTDPEDRRPTQGTPTSAGAFQSEVARVATMILTLRMAAGRWRGLSAAAPIAALLILGFASDVTASTGQAPLATEAQFDPLAGETQVQERVSANRCVSFRLGREWNLSRSADATLLQAAGSEEDLEIRIRSRAELERFPQGDMAGREAAALQHTYETLVGKPAQAIHYDPTGLPSVSRWSATWIDANIAGARHSMTIETFVVDLEEDALELTLTGSGEAYNGQVAHLLASLRVTSGAECLSGITQR
jgi:hypothetical protein